MSSTPLDQYLVSEETMQVDRDLMKKVAWKVAAIDRGSTLTKILYSTETEAEPGKLTLHFALFRNKHFEQALEFLRAKLESATDGASGKLHVTGVGSNLHGDKIRQILGVETEFVDEAFCQFVGFHFLLKNFDPESICRPLPEFEDPSFAGIQRGETFQRLRDAQVAMMKQNATGNKFPCLFAIYGSSAGVVLVHEDGSIAVKHRHLLAGKSFLGLCQLLIGTCDYAEIMRLAAAGKRGNIDTQVRDILADTPNSPYGRMPPTLPFFPFGKAVDFDKSLENTRREDIAHSLVSSFTINFTNVVAFVAGYEKVKNVFFGGNFFQDEFPRLEVAKALKLFGTAEMMSINFLKTGHTAALGAALSSEKDVAEFFADMKLKD